MTPKEETPKKLIGGRVTFLGQWTDLQVVVMVADKPAEGAKENPHKLPFPFDSADVKGKILLVRMDESATPTNFTQGEYEAFAKGILFSLLFSPNFVSVILSLSSFLIFVLFPL